MIDIEEFYNRWYNTDEDISPDEIEDATLKGMYIEYLAHEQDLFELQQKIEAYIDANSRSGREIHGERLEEIDEQPHFTGLRFSD